MGFGALRNLASAGLLFAGGCSSDSAANWASRYGPDPAMPGDQVQRSADNQLAIMNGLSKLSLNSKNEVDYYLLTLAGFNFVDEQCDVYLHELFIIDDARDRIKTGILSAGLLTNAILAASPAAKSSMAVVAQAFGLAGEFSDTVANGYLLGAHPSTILTIVSKLQASYRDQAEKDRAMINSEPSAYARIRGYLRLCLPPTIQSNINAVVSSSAAVSGKTATGGSSGGPGTSMTTRLAAPEN